MVIVDQANNDSLNPNSDGIVYNDFLLSYSEFDDDYEEGITAGVTVTSQHHIHYFLKLMKVWILV